MGKKRPKRMKISKKKKVKKVLRQSGKNKQKRQNRIVFVSVVLVLVFVSIFFLYLFKNSDTLAGEAFRNKFVSPQKVKFPQGSIMKEKIIIWTDPAQYKTDSNTWTDAIQKALDNSKHVRLQKGKIYEVVYSGDKIFRGAHYRYSLSIPSGVTLDMNGATIRLAEGQNSGILINENPGEIPANMDSDIKIFGGIFDGSEAKQPISSASEAKGQVATITMVGVEKLSVSDVTVKNSLQYFGRFLKINQGHFNNLKGVNSRGDGWSFGIATLEVSKSEIDNMYSDNTRPEFDQKQKWPVWGNSFVFTLTDSKIGKIFSTKAGGGVKIQDTSNKVTLDYTYFEGAKNDPSPNCGLKVQGNSFENPPLIPTGITVNKAVSKYCAPKGPGLYLQSIGEVTINEYSGFDNGGDYPDVWIDDNIGKLTINSITSENCHSSCVTIRSDAGDYQIGKVEVINPIGSETLGIAIIGGQGNIDEVTEMDNRVDANERRLVKVWPTAKGSVGNVITNFITPAILAPSKSKVWVPNDNSGFVVNRYQEGNFKPQGYITISKDSLSTFVDTESVYRRWTGDSEKRKYFQPVIKLSSRDRYFSRQLSSFQIELKDVQSGKGFTIKHPKLEQGMVVYWEASDWKVIDIKD